jgi:ion channel-forming bestrophin family protein
MLEYNPKDWLTFIFRFHKSDTIRQLLPMLVLIAIYAAGVAFLEIEYWKLSDNSHVKNITLMHGILSFVISMLLVFRTNTAYDRWWEGRKLWGSLVNNSRNLAIKLSAYLPKEDAENRLFFKKIIPAYAYALKNHLNHESTRTELFDDELLNKKIQHDKHVPNQVALMIIKRVEKLYQEKKLTNEHLIVLNSELQSFTDVCGACERIKNTPIPYSYSAFIKKFIFFYVMTLPFGYVFSLGYYVIPVVCFIFYVLASLELIAEEIEDPFGGDSNDLPTTKIAANIHKHVYEIL